MRRVISDEELCRVGSMIWSITRDERIGTPDDIEWNEVYRHYREAKQCIEAAKVHIAGYKTKCGKTEI